MPSKYPPDERVPAQCYRAVEISPDGTEWALPIGDPNKQFVRLRSHAQTSVNISSLGGRRDKGYTYRIETLTVTGSEDV